MYQITLKVDGMMCSMCEAHVNEAIRKAFQVKDVTSSREKGETIILSEELLNEQAVRDAVDAAGYTLQAVSQTPL